MLELPPDAVQSILSDDPVHASLFYWTLCQVCIQESGVGGLDTVWATDAWNQKYTFHPLFVMQVMDVDYREAMEEMYPGSWSHKTISSLGSGADSPTKASAVVGVHRLHRGGSF